ncbi:hypothetical protein XSR1_290049 [Xenorhabdus szentirmaii DSM 16338]|uniref:Uncharacterized protein n=1 Tax=Xenorhabdus szentirmaii DSM 16338 TaxID=1427518 RepID=W1IXF2_9GAMM|nr:hypothetical protein XSR1_290049 [Xenorhabdus szentirmaii DSM 16338]
MLTLKLQQNIFADPRCMGLLKQINPVFPLDRFTYQEKNYWLSNLLSLNNFPLTFKNYSSSANNREPLIDIEHYSAYF